MLVADIGRSAAAVRSANEACEVREFIVGLEPSRPGAGEAALRVMDEASLNRERKSVAEWARGIEPYGWPTERLRVPFELEFLALLVSARTSSPAIAAPVLFDHADGGAATMLGIVENVLDKSPNPPVVLLAVPGLELVRGPGKGGGSDDKLATRGAEDVFDFDTASARDRSCCARASRAAAAAAAFLALRELCFFWLLPSTRPNERVL